MIYNIFESNNYSNWHYLFKFKEIMGVSDIEISIAIVVVTLLLLAGWVAIFFMMKSNQIGLFTPYVPPGMTGTHPPDNSGGVPGGSNSGEKLPIYVPDATAGLNYFYPLGVQGYASAAELCARKSTFVQATQQFRITYSDTSPPKGLKPSNPPHWMTCQICDGPDWILPSGGTVDEGFLSLFPTKICQQPDSPT